ncbi:hypothetical protein KEM52_004413, partial [Ascosphaera acerosa]
LQRDDRGAVRPVRQVRPHPPDPPGHRGQHQGHRVRRLRGDQRRQARVRQAERLQLPEPLPGRALPPARPRRALAGGPRRAQAEPRAAQAAAWDCL